MELAEGIRKIGFRRWYERQLLESHVYLVTWFLCLIMVLACIEGFSFRAPGLAPLIRLAAIVAGVAAGTWALGRYAKMLGLAVRAAERSVCGKCGAYGRLEVTGLRSPERGGDGEVTLSAVGVRCRKCGHEWTIE